LKKFLFFLVCAFASLGASAQYNYYRLSLGINTGVTQAYADLAKINFKPAFSGSFDYNITPFTSAGIEIQKGSLSGGDPAKDPHLRYFNNSYMAVSLNGRAQLAQFVDFESSNLLYAIRGFYIGTGVGMINNNLVDVVRIKPDGSNYKFPGVDKGMNLFVPINTGISFNIIDRFRYTKFVLYANSQFNAMLGEDIDGYNDPKKAGFKNFRDFYQVTTVGVKYCFGPEGLF
jgi:hypothetical protein